MDNRHDPITVVVGDAELAPAVDRAAGDGASVRPVVVHVDDYLQAMGEMAHRPVGAVVGRIGPMRANMDATVRALRRTAPQTRMVVVAEAADEPDAMRAVRLGFDDYLVEPVPPARWAQVLGASAAPSPPSPSPPPTDAATEAASHATTPTAPPLKTTGPEASSSRPAPRTEQPADDLMLEQLLQDRGSVRETLIATIRQAAGPDVTWTAEPDLDARACVPIMRHTQGLGHLVSDRLTDRQLVDWADWAARWLALEHRINQLRHMAWHDELTGVRNRRYFKQFLDSVLRRAHEQAFRVTLLLFDIDDFKQYNDQFGHDAGDEILREAARLMLSVVRRHDVVARVGGDEFAVIFWDADAPRRSQSEHPHSPQRAAERFQAAICDHRFPKLADRAPGTLSISGGLASYPWDGKTPDQLIAKADQMLLAGKRQGKNCIMLGPGAIYECGRGDAPPRPAHDAGL